MTIGIGLFLQFKKKYFDIFTVIYASAFAWEKVRTSVRGKAHEPSH